MTALTGGIAPAFAKPDDGDPVIPVIPTPQVVAPEQEVFAPEQPKREAEAPAPVEVPSVEVPRLQEPPSPPVVEAPPPQAPVEVPAPQVQAPPPAPKADPPKAEQPRVEAPKAEAPRVEAPRVEAPVAEAPKAEAPKAEAPKAEAPRAPKAGPPAAPPAVMEPPAKPAEPKQDPADSNEVPAQAGPNVEVPKNAEPGKPSEPGAVAPAPDQPKAPEADEGEPETDDSRDAGGEAPTDPSISKPARIATAEPKTLEAPEQDIQLAKQSKPIELKPEPARKEDVDFLSSSINLSSKTKLGPFESEFEVGADLSVGRDRDRDWDRKHWDKDDWDRKHWDKKVRQWKRDWIEYDHFFRPIICNPFRAPVRIVYVYLNAPRIVIIPPLARVLVDAAQLAAYSFTAVVLNAVNLAADVAVGTFFGGGFVPRVGLPFVAPPPLLRYDNVPVQVRYSNATYRPFRVRQIVDMGDDVRFGGRKVLLDGATPAWGQWTTSPTGERQFEIHRTQQYPGLGEPQEAPLPGDYQMQLASDESAGMDRTQMYLMAAAGVVAGLGFGALGLAFYLGRRRPQL